MNKMNLKKYNENLIKSLINTPEGNTLDFKQKINSTAKIARTLAAMANTEGGTILVGLSDQKKIIGIDPEEEKFMIETANQRHCTPKVSIHLEVISITDSEENQKFDEEKNLLLVKIQKSKGPKIFVSDESGTKKLYIREGDQTKHVL